MQNHDGVLSIGGTSLRVFRFNTVVVGSGAAGLGAADSLWKLGQKSVAILTEGLKMGTSRNTGSDKQTYYKMSTCGDQEDSVRRMASTLFSGGAMDGDIALAEAAESVHCFFRLVGLGVPFPHNAYGEYVGYKTDHDPCKRGTSAGPLTSKFMTECLIKEIERDGPPVFERMQAIEILTTGTGKDKKAAGVLALDLDQLDSPNQRFVVFACKNVVYATGGEAGMYETSVYPPSQTGSTGIAFRAGVRGKNLTESQYGLASIKFRWNLSGTYQQVLPRYVSTDKDGNDPREFLDEHFDSPAKLLNAIFLKGYQWPFDPRKVENQGSSLIDILVFHEMVNKGRRVFLDYLRNPSCAETGGMMDFGKVEGEAREYLENSRALLPTPLERLQLMNPAAIELYKSNGIDLSSELLEIAVCAQHNNGGLAGDKWWQSNISGIFPVGEVNGSHGVYRPGGSALNSGQVGGMRASQFIASQGQGDAPSIDELSNNCNAALAKTLAYADNAIAGKGETIDIEKEIRSIRQRMTACGAHIRSADTVAAALAEAETQLRTLSSNVGIASASQLPALYKALDFAVCQYVYLYAIKDYIATGGGSRGSYLVQDKEGIRPAASLPDMFRFRLDDGKRTDQVQEIVYDNATCTAEWRAVRPLPELDDWFENVWREYRTGEIFQK